MKYPQMPYTTKNYDFHKKATKSEIDKLKLLQYYGIPMIILSDAEDDDYYTKIELMATEFINNGEELPKELAKELLRTKEIRQRKQYEFKQ